MRKLSSIRKDLGMNQEDMAKALNISLAAYQKKEQGKAPLLARELRDIASISNVDERTIEVPR